MTVCRTVLISSMRTSPTMSAPAVLVLVRGVSLNSNVLAVLLDISFSTTPVTLLVLLDIWGYLVSVNLVHPRANLVKIQ